MSDLAQTIVGARINLNTVLIIDDDIGLRTLLRVILENQQYRVFEARDGISALEFLEEVQVNAIISDVNMPGISGIQLVERLNDQLPDVPVILVTGKPDIATAVESMKIGAFNYLSKPFDIREVENTVANAIIEKFGTRKKTIERHSVVVALSMVREGVSKWFITQAPKIS